MLEPREPKPGIDQSAENSTLEGGMQAIQGDGNIQQQNRQEILKYVRVGGNLTTGNITQINQVLPTQKLNPPNNLQFQGSANFVGRAHELTLLRDRLQQVGVVAITAVAGMGGVGKTELATQYARLHEKDYPGGICWLSTRVTDLAAEIIHFTQLYMNLEVPQELLGQQLSLEQRVEWCWQNWRPTEGLALIILDDVTSLEGCGDFLPRANRFRVLMTTRVRNLDPNIEEISLDLLSPEFALEFLTKLVGKKRVQRELEVAKQLCEWLGYLPLGLELVGRYVAKKPPNYKLAQMLERLKAQRLSDEAINSVSDSKKKNLSTAQRGVLAAFELSWRSLDEMTQRVAALLSLFAPNIFAWEWVESASELLNWEDADVQTANEQLYGFHLIQWVEDFVRIHTLIREFLLVKLAALEQADDLKRGFVEVMVAIAKTIPYSPTVELINSVKDGIPHLAEVAQNLTDAVSDENLIWVFVGLDRFYSGQGLYVLAEPWLEQCVSVVQTRLGEKHPFVAGSYNNLGLLYLSQGRYSKAEPLFIKALELRKRLLTEEHSDVATSYNNLAYLYLSQGRYSEAEPLYIKALELNQRLLSEKHPDVATSYNNLAYFYTKQGRYSKAEPLYIKALELRQRLLTEEHLYTASSYNNLAELYRSQGRYSEAELLYKKALQLRQRLLGEEHPDVAQSYNNLASLYYNQEKYQDAEPLLIKALELNQRLLTEEHPDVAQSYNNLAELYRSQGRYSEAEPLFIKALELRKRLLTEEHPLVAQSYNNLASLYLSQGRYSEAEPLYKKALELASKSLGVDHSSTTTIRENLKSLCDTHQ